MRRRALHRRYGRSAASQIVEIENLLRARGYRDAAAHARAFVRDGRNAADLLDAERKYGKFPVSSPIGYLRSAKRTKKWLSRSKRHV